jgi:hypothetical protein
MTSMTDSILPDDLNHQAADLAFAMLRFAGGAAHLEQSHNPPGMPRTGIDCYIFAPSWRSTPNADAPKFLGRSVFACNYQLDDDARRHHADSGR